MRAAPGAEIRIEHPTDINFKYFCVPEFDGRFSEMKTQQARNDFHGS